MDEKKLSSPLDAALAQVDPDRRKFLGMLLAGVAAAPMLTSAALAAEEKPNYQKNQKNDAAIKDGSAIKNGKSADLKMNGSKSQIKYWDKTTPNNSRTIKDSGGKGAGTEYKGQVKNNTNLKLSNSTLKGSNNTIKGSNNTIK